MSMCLAACSGVARPASDTAKIQINTDRFEYSGKVYRSAKELEATLDKNGIHTVEIEIVKCVNPAVVMSMVQIINELSKHYKVSISRREDC